MNSFRPCAVFVLPLPPVIMLPRSRASGLRGFSKCPREPGSSSGPRALGLTHAPFCVLASGTPRGPERLEDSGRHWVCARKASSSFFLPFLKPQKHFA